jgi:hypothetical protein
MVSRSATTGSMTSATDAIRSFAESSEPGE